MLLTKSLLLSFITSICCSPINTSAGILNAGCTKPIHQHLDSMQGLKPNLKQHLQFGYIYDVDSPQVDLNTDMPINPLEQHSWIPSKAVAILSGISYSELDSKLILTSRISEPNASKLKLASLESANIKFGTFAYDRTEKKWCSSLKNEKLGGTFGKVAKSSVIYKQNGQDSHFELELELIPLKNADKIQFLNYAIDGISHLQIKWNGLTRNKCRKNGDRNSVLSKGDHFNEIIESAVLL
ncbi:hypothetical protein BD408DRAFT_422972 [Parasitella parasitica]|nr:hypothetical protein BD408DRAFT_422972 [Parasitella parasitica]